MQEKLKKLLENSYSPYYKFRVSAIVVCNDGKEFSGVNVETSSPGAGLCAERVALYSAIASGYSKDDFKELHVMLDNDEVGYPCFVCRQALSDFLSSITPVFLYTSTDKVEKVFLKELIPFPFNDEDLK